MNDVLYWCNALIECLSVSEEIHEYCLGFVVEIVAGYEFCCAGVAGCLVKKSSSEYSANSAGADGHAFVGEGCVYRTN